MKLISFLAILGFYATVAGAQSQIHANAQRMEQRIKALSAFGANPQGGVSRVAYSEADLKGREYVISLMKDAGLTVRIDAAGNIIGRRDGKNNKLPVIAYGSHIDSVPEGGNYDGDVGSIGAIECIELLKENKITTEHPLEVIIFQNEEGGLYGSAMLCGAFDREELSNVANSGKTIREGVKLLGGDPDHLDQAIRNKNDFMAFMELHIEQGGILEKSNLNIGVVEGIVGISQWDVTIEGKANHAGTTPMDQRQDALLAASRLVIAVNEIVRSIPGRQVGTVGRIHAEPGAPNVVPGRVVMSLEIRDLEQSKIDQVFNAIRKEASDIENSNHVRIQFAPLNKNAPAITDTRIQDVIAESAQDLHLTFQRMPSGAGHDSQDMARITPTGMIFVPSHEGISHSPKEFTSAEDMANGASVLFHSILKIDRIKF